MGKVKQFLADCIEDGARNWDAAVRGTLCPIAPILAGMALAKGLKLGAGILKGIGQKKAAKEAAKKMEQNAEGQFKADQANFANQEGSRQARAGFIGGQLKGARALPPEVIAQITAAKKDPSFKKAIVDPSKGMGWGLAGDVAGGVGDIASSYVKGLGMQSGGADASQPTSLLPTSSSGPFQIQDREDWKLH
jgi:hypothetical protein